VLAKGTAAAQQQQQRQAQQQQGGVRKARFSNSISLNKQIMNTHNTRDLHTIVRSKGSMFDFFNISSAIARVPKLVGGSGGVQVGYTPVLWTRSQLFSCSAHHQQCAPKSVHPWPVA
jgi:hypothetical protein